MRFLFVVHKNEEKAEQNSVLFHRLTLKERGLRPNGYFPLMRQPLLLDRVDKQDFADISKAEVSEIYLHVSQPTRKRLAFFC